MISKSSWLSLCPSPRLAVVTATYFAVTVCAAMALAVAARAASFPPVTEAELALKEVPGYPAAPAVVLFEKGVFQIMDYPRDVSSVMNVHVRLKILTEEGLEYGEIEVRHSAFYRLRNLVGRTVLPDGREVDLPQDSIFEERTSRSRKQFLTKATFPALEVGAVLDYSYQLRWDTVYFAEPWYFSHERIPTLHSEVTYYKPGNLALVPVARAPKSLPVQSETRKEARGLALRVWMENPPAIPDEPYSLPFEDLSSYFMAVPKEIRTGGAVVKFMDSWKTVCNDFDEIMYSPAGKKGRQAKKHAQELAAGAGSRREQAIAVYAFVRDEVITDSSRIFIAPGALRGRRDRYRRVSPHAARRGVGPQMGRLQRQRAPLRRSPP